MKNSAIEWTHHTFNPWIGCTKVSPGCVNCYAEAQDKRWRPGDTRWGKGVPRTRTTPANWAKPIQWDAEAAKLGQRHRVFCASLADVFDAEVDPKWRDDLFTLINRTEHLDWLLLTKRPENVHAMCPGGFWNWPNLWLGTTVEDQPRADERVPLLRAIPAAVHFLSVEPLVAPVKLDLLGIEWVICGGESGHGSRPMSAFWARDVRDQCVAAGVPFLFKQWGDFDASGNRVGKKSAGRLLDGVQHDGYPVPAPGAE